MLKEPRKNVPVQSNPRHDTFEGANVLVVAKGAKFPAAKEPHGEEALLGEALAKLTMTPAEIYEHANQFGAKFITAAQIERTLQFLIKRAVTTHEMAQVMLTLDPTSAFKTSIGKVDLKHFKAKFPKLYKIGVDEKRNGGLDCVASVALAALAAQKEQMKAGATADTNDEPFAIGDVVEVGVGDTDDDVQWLPAEIEAAAEASGAGFFRVRMLQGYDDEDCRFDTDPAFIRRVPHTLDGTAVLPSRIVAGLETMVWYAQGQACHSAVVLEVRPRGASCVVLYPDFHDLTEEVPFVYLRNLNATESAAEPATEAPHSAVGTLDDGMGSAGSPSKALAEDSVLSGEDEDERVEDLCVAFPLPLLLTKQRMMRSCTNCKLHRNGFH
jgi:hypothetical protein